MSHRLMHFEKKNALPENTSSSSIHEDHEWRSTPATTANARERDADVKSPVPPTATAFLEQRHSRSGGLGARPARASIVVSGRAEVHMRGNQEKAHKM